MKLIFVRHGETIENAREIIMGHHHGTLSALGKKQAKDVANKLKYEKIDYIYSSDLDRAADTAKEIAKFHPKTPIKFTKELRERFLGSFQGEKRTNMSLKGKEAIYKMIEKEGGVETAKEFYNRAKRFLNKVAKKHPRSTVLFVSHNGIGKAIKNIINHRRPEEFLSEEKLENASVSTFEIN